MQRDEFIARLSGPLYTYRMAKGRQGQKGADKMLANAAEKIDSLVLEYALDVVEIELNEMTQELNNE